LNPLRIMRRHTLSAEYFACSLALACLLAGCKAPDLPAMISPYRMDIQQGNVITQDMISKLKSGMTRSQVRFVLGSPLIVDPFRTDRWDYVSIYEKQGKEVERRRVTVIFENDKLARIEGDVVAGNGMQKNETTVEVPPLANQPPLAPLKPLTPLTFSKPEAAPLAPAAKPEAAKSALPQFEKPPVADKAPLNPANPVTFSKPPATPPDAIDAPAADATKPAAEATGDAATADATKAVPAAAADDKKGDPAKKDEPKDKPKQPGFFGRMLEKIGL
jgi:outer membrane protein assembly factor BamE